MAKHTGRIKSYNMQKGWGFIECPETQQVYGKDIFVMKKVLPGGHAEKGDTVSFEVRQGASGPEATEVELHPEGGGRASGGNAIGSKAWAVSRAPPGGGRNSKGFLGFVKSYNPTKGWGFVTSEALYQLYGKDIFFMKNSIRSSDIQAGDQVRFSIMQGARGPEATDLQPAGMAASIAGAGSAASSRRIIGAGPLAVASGRGAAPALAALPAPGPMPGGLAAGGGQLLFGVVKGYNAERGWGHIDCAAASQLYGKDVFLMRSAVGEQSVQQGTLVSFRVTIASRGPHATDVRALPDGSFGNAAAQGSFFEGVVKSFNSEKGWGFITSEDITQLFGKDIFLHKQELNGTVPEPGEPVQFTVEPGKTGQLEAKNVSMGGEAQAPAPEAVPDEHEYDSHAYGRSAPRPSAAVGRRAAPY